jgi:hypothetical protein
MFIFERGMHIDGVFDERLRYYVNSFQNVV